MPLVEPGAVEVSVGASSADLRRTVPVELTGSTHPRLGARRPTGGVTVLPEAR